MGEERDVLMRRGALLEDRALLMPVVRKSEAFCRERGGASTIAPSSEIWEV